jgi:uncharacterized protein (TIGR03086 family)
MTFTKTAHLPVPPDEAFALVTRPDRLRRWQAVSAYVDLRAGGEYRWTITPGHVAAGTFREVEPGKRIVFGWGWEGSSELPPDASMITVTVEPAEGGSLVTLVHEGLDEQQTAQHAEGWHHYFERLERLASTGTAGQDEWAWAPEDLDPVVAAEAALATIQPMLRSLTPDDQPKPTPCADFSCHELAEHLFVSLEQIGGMAGVSVVNPKEGSLENRISVMAAQAIDGWRARGLQGSIPGHGDDEMPASFAASVLPLELILHGWDLAQGSGQELHASDELIAYLQGLAEVVVPSGRLNGSFGAEVVPADDASPLDQLAAYAGRKPVAA